MVLTHSRLICVLFSGDARRPSTLHIVVIVIIMTTILNILMSPVTIVLHCAELFLNMWFCHGLCRETAKCRFNEQKDIICTKFEKRPSHPSSTFAVANYLSFQLSTGQIVQHEFLSKLCLAIELVLRPLKVWSQHSRRPGTVQRKRYETGFRAISSPAIPIAHKVVILTRKTPLAIFCEYNYDNSVTDEN